jgi:DNA-binding LytR/AlgR family response regulator
MSTTHATHATALIADDEPLLRERLASHLALLWPELTVVAQARNGREALDLFEQHQPQVVFLDVRMPGLSGIDAARGMVGRTEIMFVTAYEQYAVQAFEQGALDYLVKPFEDSRLAETVQRVRRRLAASEPVPSSLLRAQEVQDQLLDRLAAELSRRAPPGAPTGHLQWIKASIGSALRLIPVNEVVYLRSDEKYTLVAWSGGEALIRKTIRELADELDPAVFVQTHRSVIVNLRHVSQVVRSANETAHVHLHGHTAVLPVSRNYAHVFRQM